MLDAGIGKEEETEHMMNDEIHRTQRQQVMGVTSPLWHPPPSGLHVSPFASALAPTAEGVEAWSSPLVAFSMKDTSHDEAMVGGWGTVQELPGETYAEPRPFTTTGGSREEAQERSCPPSAPLPRSLFSPHPRDVVTPGQASPREEAKEPARTVPSQPERHGEEMTQGRERSKRSTADMEAVPSASSAIPICGTGKRIQTTATTGTKTGLRSTATSPVGTTGVLGKRSKATPLPSHATAARHSGPIPLLPTGSPQTVKGKCFATPPSSAIPPPSDASSPSHSRAPTGKEVVAITAGGRRAPPTSKKGSRIEHRRAPPFRMKTASGMDTTSPLIGPQRKRKGRPAKKERGEARGEEVPPLHTTKGVAFVSRPHTSHVLMTPAVSSVPVASTLPLGKYSVATRSLERTSKSHRCPPSRFSKSKGSGTIHRAGKEEERITAAYSVDARGGKENVLHDAASFAEAVRNTVEWSIGEQGAEEEEKGTTTLKTMTKYEQRSSSASDRSCSHSSSSSDHIEQHVTEKVSSSSPSLATAAAPVLPPPTSCNAADILHDPLPLRAKDGDPLTPPLPSASPVAYSTTCPLSAVMPVSSVLPCSPPTTVSCRKEEPEISDRKGGSTSSPPLMNATLLALYPDSPHDPLLSHQPQQRSPTREHPKEIHRPTRETEVERPADELVKGNKKKLRKKRMLLVTSPSPTPASTRYMDRAARDARIERIRASRLAEGLQQHLCRCLREVYDEQLNVVRETIKERKATWRQYQIEQGKRMREAEKKSREAYEVLLQAVASDLQRKVYAARQGSPSYRRPSKVSPMTGTTSTSTFPAAPTVAVTAASTGNTSIPFAGTAATGCVGTENPFLFLSKETSTLLAYYAEAIREGERGR